MRRRAAGSIFWQRHNPAGGAFTDDPSELTIRTRAFGNAFAVVSTGTDIWNNADQFRFAFKSLSGVQPTMTIDEQVELSVLSTITFIDANWTGLSKMQAWADKLGNQPAAA